MSVNKDILLKALIQENYFPLQKKSKEEFPPIFHSRGIKKKTALEILNLPLDKDRKMYGYDVAVYNATRFNNVPRLLSIPHPKPYIDACFKIHDNWSNIRYICSNQNSLIRPRKHKDGRVIIMDYESSYDQRNRYFKRAFGKKFTAHTDIANCFHSLYSHAIPWALVGFNKSKGNRKSSEWFNQVDAAFRRLNRNETSGVPIGPAISNVASEIILARVDKVLKKDFSYVRFIDDYTAYCKSYEEAEEFIRTLSVELNKYRLNLNIKKTEIKSLPQAIASSWVGELREIIPNEKDISSSKVSNILDAAVRLQKDNPDGSILKYAAKSIVSKLDVTSSVEFAKYIIKLSYHYPVLIPLLMMPLDKVYKQTPIRFDTQLCFLLKDAVKYRRSDAMNWLLYFLKKHHNKIPADIAKGIVATGDSLALTMLAEFTSHEGKVIKFANSLNKNDLYELDNYWLLLYQLYYKGLIKNPYKDKVFSVLKKHKVTFVDMSI